MSREVSLPLPLPLLLPDVFDRCFISTVSGVFNANRTNQNLCIELLVHRIRASVLDGEVLS